MIDYTSQYQTQFEEFTNLCQLQLDPANRWVQLAHLLPWDRMVSIYQKNFSVDMGATAINPRWFIGAFIIKHKLGLSDEEVLQTISENPYMQYFLGLANFNRDPLFSPSLFVQFRKVAHRRYLSQAKKKKDAIASLRKTLRYLLNCVERNLAHLDAMLDDIATDRFPLVHKYQRQLWVIRTLYEQQRSMYEQRSNQCPDRIVSISQPHVRASVHGKPGKPVEFGAKLGLSLFDSYLTHQTMSWDAYNDAGNLQVQVETYRLLTCYYPNLIQCDKTYHTNENRSWCCEQGIRLTAAEKDPKKKKTAYQKRKQHLEYAERNHIEGRIGNAKQAPTLDKIKAKLRDTSETWIATTLFVLNLTTFAAYAGVTF